MRIEFVKLGAQCSFIWMSLCSFLDRVSWSAGTILQGSKVDLRMHRGSLS